MTATELERIEQQRFTDLQTCLKHAEFLRDKWREAYAQWKKQERLERQQKTTNQHEIPTT